MFEPIQSNSAGTLTWIGARPARGVVMDEVTSAQVKVGRGLVGDRYQSVDGKRQITLIQWEHLSEIAIRLNIPSVAPTQLRRNLAVSGINLIRLKGQQFYIGEVLFEYSGLCQPCSAMDRTFGPGGYQAVAGRGGITAKVLSDGILHVGDKIYLRP